MTCIKKIQNTEVFGSRFTSRTLTIDGDNSDYSFKAVVKNIIQGKILEIPGVKNAGTINFDFSQLETLKKSTYQIEYWGDFGALGNEPFLLEEFSIVSAENATNCTNSDNLNFEIKIEEISIPVTITKAINNFSLDFESLTDEQKAQLKGDAFTYEDFTPTQIAELQKPATDKVEELDALELSLNNSESLRVQNENTRISNEETRNTNEIDRSSSENSRQENEVSRQENENERILSETERNDTEIVRISNENNRIAHEDIRNINEQTRINAETERINAETSRSSSENTRIASETERVSNENLRKTAENARTTAETSRATAETSRSNAENTRSNAENTRISNENNRISAENTRASNESGRVTAENARVTAENARVAAELEREKNKPVNIKVTTPTPYVTNTVSETEVYRLPLPPGTFNQVDVLKIPLMLVKKLGTNGTIQVRGKMSTSPTMPSGTTDLIFTTPVATAGNQTLGIIKTFFIDGGNIKGTQFTGPSYTDNNAAGGVISEKPFDIYAMNYLYISVINGSANDQTRLEGFQLTNS